MAASYFCYKKSMTLLGQITDVQKIFREGISMISGNTNEFAVNCGVVKN